MQKEPLQNSERFKLALGTVILELLILASAAYGIDVEPELMATVSVAIAGVMSMLIYGRTVRNTPTEPDTQIFKDFDFGD